VIEVALIISTCLDAAGADERHRKDDTPKGLFSARQVLGTGAKSCRTVIVCTMGRYPIIFIMFIGPSQNM